jgi:RNA methyltransferase, TrmH family
MNVCKSASPLRRPASKSPLIISSSRRPISDARNASIAAVLRLMEDRAERERTGLFYTEGLRFVYRALESRFAPIEAVLVAPDLLPPPFGRRLLQKVRDAALPVVEVTPTVFRRLSRVDEPQGIGAVVRQRWDRLSRVRPDAGLCWVLLDTVRAPGNLGTVLRAMDAVGAAGVILLGQEIDPYSPDAVRATMGALFALRYIRTTVAEFDRWRERHGVTLVGTSPHASDDYCAYRYPERLVLWMGGERKGLSPEQMAACDKSVQIPMVGSSDSLNLATATSVLLYEVFNQRRRDAGHKSLP